MKKFLGLALAGALSVAALPAVAADYPVKAPPPPLWTWTGFYVGVSAGAGWSHQDWSNVPNGGGLNTGNFVGSGGVIGFDLGYNWQVPGTPWVFGVEGDINWTNLTGTTAVPGCSAAFNCTTKLDWFGTVRGRFGHTNGPLLFYITGGWAGGELNHTFAGSNVTDNANGWAAGGGLEGALGGGWLLRAEYLYIDLGSTLACGLPTCAPNVTNLYYRAHIARAGINYKY